MRIRSKATQHAAATKTSAVEFFILNTVPGLALLSGLRFIPAYFGFNLTDHPSETLAIASAFQFMISFPLYTAASMAQKRCASVFEAVKRSFFSLLFGAILVGFAAFTFGAPIEIQQTKITAYWSLLMSSIVVVPSGIVLGNAWSDWQRLFAFSRPKGVLETSICIPAHGAVIGAWFGSWPMPLDWERKWQEWPVCVTYGMVIGFLVGEIISFVLLLLVSDGKQARKKKSNVTVQLNPETKNSYPFINEKMTEFFVAYCTYLIL